MDLKGKRSVPIGKPSFSSTSLKTFRAHLCDIFLSQGWETTDLKAPTNRPHPPTKCAVRKIIAVPPFAPFIMDKGDSI
jgi:hypothetical protein